MFALPFHPEHTDTHPQRLPHSERRGSSPNSIDTTCILFNQHDVHTRRSQTCYLGSVCSLQFSPASATTLGLSLGFETDPSVATANLPRAYKTSSSEPATPRPLRPLLPLRRNNPSTIPTSIVSTRRPHCTALSQCLFPASCKTSRFAAHPPTHAPSALVLTLPPTRSPLQWTLLPGRLTSLGPCPMPARRPRASASLATSRASSTAAMLIL